MISFAWFSRCGEMNINFMEGCIPFCKIEKFGSHLADIWELSKKCTLTPSSNQLLMLVFNWFRDSGVVQIIAMVIFAGSSGVSLADYCCYLTLRYTHTIIRLLCTPWLSLFSTDSSYYEVLFAATLFSPKYFQWQQFRASSAVLVYEMPRVYERCTSPTQGSVKVYFRVANVS